MSEMIRWWGWGWPTMATAVHHFVNGTAVCGRWPYLDSGENLTEVEESLPLCATCVKRLVEGRGKPPTRGDRFEHARQITGDGDWRRPMTCTVTRVAQGTVYYRNETGFLSYMSVERFPTIVKHWLRRER